MTEQHDRVDEMFVTERERQILDLGLTEPGIKLPEVAQRLHISLGTVKHHLALFYERHLPLDKRGQGSWERAVALWREHQDGTPSAKPSQLQEQVPDPLVGEFVGIMYEVLHTLDSLRSIADRLRNLKTRPPIDSRDADEIKREIGYVGRYFENDARRFMRLKNQLAVLSGKVIHRDDDLRDAVDGTMTNILNIPDYKDGEFEDWDFDGVTEILEANFDVFLFAHDIKMSDYEEDENEVEDSDEFE